MTVETLLLFMSTLCSLIFALFATPSLVFFLGRNRGRTWGVHFNDKNVIPYSKKIKTVVFRGTDLTESEPTVTDIISFSEYPKESIWDLATLVVQKTEQPLGSDTTTIIEDRTITVGHGDYLIKKSVIQDGAFDRGLGRALSLASEGKRVVHLAEQGHYVGLIALQYPLKLLSRRGIRSLQVLGIQTVMVSEEETRTAIAIGRSMGIDRVIGETRLQESWTQFENPGNHRNKTALVINSTERSIFQTIGAPFTIILGEPSNLQNDTETHSQKKTFELTLSHGDSIDIAMALSYLKRLQGINTQNLFLAFFSGFFLALDIPMIGRPSFSILFLFLFLAPILMVLNVFRIVFFRFPTQNLDKQEDETKGPSNTVQKILTIDGMSCGHCTIKVKSALEDVPGVTQVSVDLITKKARIAGSDISDRDLQEAVNNAGYRLTGILG